MSESVKTRGYAKINLFLRVLGERGRYHEIETLQQSVDLFDEITLTKRDDDLLVSSFPEDNSLVVLKKLKDTYHLGGMQIEIEKHIPIGGGLGGSSADAAAAALACARLWHLDEKEVRESVKDLFGDIAFQMIGGTAIARGMGSEVESLPPLPEYGVLLAFPDKGVSTAEAYRLSHPSDKAGDPKALYDALCVGEKADYLYQNDLLSPAIKLNDEIAPLLEMMQNDSALLSGMSGSGSTLFALYRTRKEAEIEGEKLTCSHLAVKTIKAFSPQ